MVHVETVGSLLEAVDRRELSPVMDLPDELELRGLGQTGKYDVQVDIVGAFLPHPFESKPEVPSLRKEVHGVTARKVSDVEEIVVTRTPRFLCLSVETRVESSLGRPPIPPRVGPRPLFSTDGELRRPGGLEEKEGKQATVLALSHAATASAFAAVAVGRSPPSRTVRSSGAWKLIACDRFIFLSLIHI